MPNSYPFQNFQIPPTVNTDNKNGYQGSDREATSERLGVVASEGEALFDESWDDIPTCYQGGGLYP